MGLRHDPLSVAEAVVQQPPLLGQVALELTGQKRAGHLQGRNEGRARTHSQRWAGHLPGGWGGGGGRAGRTFSRGLVTLATYGGRI